jgi:hypothetical protein
MVDDTQNYWVFGLFPSSGILGNRGHEIKSIVERKRGSAKDGKKFGIQDLH